MQLVGCPDLGEARLELLITVVFAFAAGLTAPVVLVAALCQGRDADVQMNTKQGSKAAFRYVSILWTRFRMVFRVALQSVVWAYSWHLKAAVRRRRGRKRLFIGEMPCCYGSDFGVTEKWLWKARKEFKAICPHIMLTSWSVASHFE
ncbi:hypothetical protein CB1_000138053 [Camelus ferus]|nr:hypothetical protein CB1_000138053 [Camelus ferus]